MTNNYEELGYKELRDLVVTRELKETLFQSMKGSKPTKAEMIEVLETQDSLDDDWDDGEDWDEDWNEEVEAQPEPEPIPEPEPKAKKEKKTREVKQVKTVENLTDEQIALFDGFTATEIYRTGRLAGIKFNNKIHDSHTRQGCIATLLEHGFTTARKVTEEEWANRNK